MRRFFPVGKFETKIICFDFDGVLHSNNDADGRGTGVPNFEIIKLIKKLKKKGFDLVIATSRPESERGTVEGFLAHHDLSLEVSMSGKPIADLYIDDKGLFYDPRTLEIIIDLWFSGSPKNYSDETGEKRFDSGMDKNISAMDEINGQKSDDKFIVGLPFSGGLDSTTLHHMLIDAGFPYRPFYFDFGQEYADHELSFIKKIFPKIDVVEMGKLDQHKHVLYGRNLSIILYTAHLLSEMGYWGEIWFGNTQGESRPVGGDKSSRFFVDVQNILSFSGLPFRVVNPLAGMNKIDIVNHGKRDPLRLDSLIKTKSCFSGEEWACCKCKACFKKFVAFYHNGIDITHTYPTDWKERFDKVAKNYYSEMCKAVRKSDFSKHTPSRALKTLEVVEKCFM